MKRSKTRRTRRWSETPRSTTVRFPVVDGAAAQPESRDTVPPVLGPYEAAYDVSHGYSLDRSIVLP